MFIFLCWARHFLNELIHHCFCNTFHTTIQYWGFVLRTFFFVKAIGFIAYVYAPLSCLAASYCLVILAVETTANAHSIVDVSLSCHHFHRHTQLSNLYELYAYMRIWQRWKKQAWSFSWPETSFTACMIDISKSVIILSGMTDSISILWAAETANSDTFLGEHICLFSARQRVYERYTYRLLLGTIGILSHCAKYWKELKKYFRSYFEHTKTWKTLTQTTYLKLSDRWRLYILEKNFFGTNNFWNVYILGIFFFGENGFGKNGLEEMFYNPK